jgi:hypothetical protein
MRNKMRWAESSNEGTPTTDAHGWTRILQEETEKTEGEKDGIIRRVELFSSRDGCDGDGSGG